MNAADRREMFWYFGVPIAFAGWVFFLLMATIRLSGAVIYATNDSATIEAIDPVWEHQNNQFFTGNESPSGTRLSIKLGGR